MNDIFTGYASTDGASWTLVTTAMNSGTPATLLVGMRVCPRVTNLLNISTLDNVSVNSVWPPVIPQTPVRISSSVVGNTLRFSWPSDPTGWQLQAQTNSAAAGLGTNWITIPASTVTNQIFLPVDDVNGSVFFPIGLSLTACWNMRPLRLLIDTWGMTIMPVPETFSGSVTISMPGKPYHALRLTVIKSVRPATTLPGL